MFTNIFITVFNDVIVFNNLFWTHALPQGTQAEFRSPLIQTGSILACVPGLDPSLPSEEIGSSDPDLSDSDWDESGFQFILSNP